MAGRSPFIGAFRAKSAVPLLLAVVIAVVAYAFLRHPAATAADAVAEIEGGPLAPNLKGSVSFEEAPGGTWVTVEVDGLPPYLAGTPPIGPHGFHIHEVGDCTVGDPADPFLAAGSHFNPDRQPHGNHAGDFPVLFSHQGHARMSLFTDRFRPADVVGRAVIIHENPDDFRSDPAGNSGRRLGCGVVRRPG
ncbi:MAG: superoxide dismutase family protein [Bacillota bacterium]